MKYRARPIVPSDIDLPAGLFNTEPHGVRGGYHEGKRFDSLETAVAWSKIALDRHPEVSYVELEDQHGRPVDVLSRTQRPQIA